MGGALTASIPDAFTPTALLIIRNEMHLIDRD